MTTRVRGDASNPTERSWQHLVAAEPELIGIVPANAFVPNMGPGAFLHSGPPIAWNDLTEPSRGAIAAIATMQGDSESPVAALLLGDDGQFTLDSAQDHGCIGPVSGIVGYRTPLLVVREKRTGQVVGTPLNEGRGAVIRYGSHDEAARTRLAEIETKMVVAFQSGLESGPIDLIPHMSAGLHLGDDLHNRPKGFTWSLLHELMGRLLQNDFPGPELKWVLSFLSTNGVFGVNIVMAAAKAMLDTAHGVPGSALVTSMGQNGRQIGIRLSGCGDNWFVAPAPKIDGVYFDGWTEADSCPAIGDSIITECVGFGGFAAANAPVIAKYVGGSLASAMDTANAMTTITVGLDDRFTLPGMEYRGVASGIDARKVLEFGIRPMVNAGIAHAEMGVGQIGGGYVQVPMDPFRDGCRALDSEPGVAAACTSTTL